MKKSAMAFMIAAAIGSAGLTSYADVISDVPSQVDSSSSTGTAPPPASTSQSSSSSSASGSAGSTSSASSSSSGTTSVIIGGSSTGSATTTAEDIAINVGNGETVIVDVPGSLPDLPSVRTIGPGASSSSSTGSTGTSVIISGSGASTDLSGTEVGSQYSSDAKVKVDLGYTLISPNVDYNGFKVAEGSVQLKDGSWDTIGHDKYIRQPYFKLLREDGDWYVVSVNSRRIGNYTTPDGSTITELWLKKSDCTAKNYIELNTSNTKRQAIVKYALSLLGKGYQYAGNGPDVYDCSGFVNHVMSTNGIKVARNSTAICQNGREVGINGLRPGDIVGRSGHVGIYIGDGYFVHAAESSTGVITDSVAIYNRSSAFTSYRNVAGD